MLKVLTVLSLILITFVKSQNDITTTTPESSTGTTETTYVPETTGPTKYPRLPPRLQHMLDHQNQVLESRNNVTMFNPKHDCNDPNQK